MTTSIQRVARMTTLVAALATLTTQYAIAFPNARNVAIRFVNSPLSDYLFYLFYRNTADFPDISTRVPLTGVATLDYPISVPEVVDSEQLTAYDNIYAVLAPYRNAQTRIYEFPGIPTRYRILSYDNVVPSFATLQAIIAAGKPSYDAFYSLWLREIAPKEAQQMATWRLQIKGKNPLITLQQLERLRFPFGRLDVGAIALHLSGSGNTDPPGVYTSLFRRPNVFWTLGHEATHLMVDNQAGARWMGRRRAAIAIALVEARGGVAFDIEESLCLFMQVKLSQVNHLVSPTYRESDRLPASVKKDLVRAFEDGWDKYQRSTQGDIIDFMLDQTIATLQPQAK